MSDGGQSCQIAGAERCALCRHLPIPPPASARCGPFLVQRGATGAATPDRQCKATARSIGSGAGHAGSRSDFWD